MLFPVMPWGPIVDGEELTETPIALIRKGIFNRVPLLLVRDFLMLRRDLMLSLRVRTGTKACHIKEAHSNSAFLCSRIHFC